LYGSEVKSYRQTLTANEKRAAGWRARAVP
jgi:hypothetical protein